MLHTYAGLTHQLGIFPLNFQDMRLFLSIYLCKKMVAWIFWNGFT